MFIYFRFEVEIFDFENATKKEILNKVRGKFGIFCCAWTKIDEELIKNAG